MGYSMESSTDDCYEGTHCLVNKFGIKDEEKLKSFEAAVTFAKISELENGQVSFPFTPEGYKGIHRYLFEDLYDWAGEYRKIDISKKGTVFAGAADIERLMNNCFERLSRSAYYESLPRKQFVESIADLYQTLNMIHPFREGNGRTERVFISALVRSRGMIADFSNVNEDELMISTILAAGGVRDGLIDVFSRIIE